MISSAELEAVRNVRQMLRHLVLAAHRSRVPALDADVERKYQQRYVAISRNLDQLGALHDRESKRQKLAANGFDEVARRKADWRGKLFEARERLQEMAYGD